MSALDPSSRFDDPDAAYRAIATAHRGLSDEESARMNCALVLILANQVGDRTVLDAALALALRAIGKAVASEGGDASSSRFAG